MPSFRPVTQPYFDTMLGLSTKLIRGLALALDLDDDYFADYCTRTRRFGCCTIRRSRRTPLLAKKAPTRTAISAA
jgi:hypothetical protein